MKKLSLLTKVLLTVLAVAGLMFNVSCHKDDPMPDQPTDTTHEPDRPANVGYLVMGGDTLHIFAVCKTQSTAASIDISFSDRPEMLFTIQDSYYEPNASAHPVKFNINSNRSTSSQGDIFDGTMEVIHREGVYVINFSGATATGRVSIHYEGSIDDADLPAGSATLTVGSTIDTADLARVFSYDQTYSYLIYSAGYRSALKITSLHPLEPGEYQVVGGNLSTSTVQVQVIYFHGQYVNLKPNFGTLVIGRNGGQFDLSLQAPTSQGDLDFSYLGTFNRQCVVDF